MILGERPPCVFDIMFELVSSFAPQGDQPQAIDKLCASLSAGNRHQTLLGVTGSGKTFTMANIIERMQKPTLILCHNKTLAAQLYSEFKNFFPHNAVEYFVSYFDYYQPEAYIARTDTYIEKDSSVNDEIERLRLSTMGTLLSRKDVIVIASVSCIYGLGSPEDYMQMMIPLAVGQQMDRNAFLARLVELLFERNDVEFGRGQFRVRGDVVEVRPAEQESQSVRVEFFDDEIERISLVDTRSGKVKESVAHYTFFPAKQFVSTSENRVRAIKEIRKEMEERVAFFEKEKKLLEAQRLKIRTENDLEMLSELGFCQGIENYSRHLTGREEGETPHTLLDFFPEGFLTLIDESHATIPQIGGMYEGDKSRKTVLVEHGFRLPSALDNRPLRYDEFMKKTGAFVYVSATPGPYEIINSRSDNASYIPVRRRRPGEQGELSESGALLVDKGSLILKTSGIEQKVEDFHPERKGTPLVVEQILRPTGLLDPIITLRPLEGQIDETIELCHQRVAQKERVLITTLTKKTAEDLTEYLKGAGLQVAYIHADIDTLERVEILRALRRGQTDVLVGINLLREGLDLPEVSLVCVLDADKEGFLRNETSLIQTAGRVARHVRGQCVLFCDVKTDSICKLLEVTAHRRAIQQKYNEEQGIIPFAPKREEQESLHLYGEEKESASSTLSRLAEDDSLSGLAQTLEFLEEEMKKAAARWEFERAAELRDQIELLKERQEQKS